MQKRGRREDAPLSEVYSKGAHNALSPSII